MAAERQRRVLSPAQQAALAKGRAGGTWRKGQSGNPKGPKPGLRDLRELLEAAMQQRDHSHKGTRLERMVRNLARKLADADERAVEFVGKRVWPAPLQVDLAGSLDVAVDAGLGSLIAALDRLEAGEAPAIGAGIVHLNGDARNPGSTQ